MSKNWEVDVKKWEVDVKKRPWGVGGRSYMIQGDLCLIRTQRPSAKQIDNYMAETHTAYTRGS
jgi:hypothetical protein